MRAFVEARIKPYYLHHARPRARHRAFPHYDRGGPGAGAALRGRLSGLCQPTYVLDIPGGHGKAPIAAAAVEVAEDGHVVTDFRGGRHHYRG